MEIDTFMTKLRDEIFIFETVVFISNNYEFCFLVLITVEREGGGSERKLSFFFF